MTRAFWVEAHDARRAITTTLFVALIAFVAPATAPAQEKTAAEPTVQDRQLQQALLGQVDGEEGPAKLEADSIDYDPKNEVVRATGDVQVFFGDRVLRADELIYDAKKDEITATGNIQLINPDGSVLTADRANFDSKVRNGLIQGAKAILGDGRSRIASVEGRRVDGKFTQLSKAVFSPCDVCKDNPTPLWRIRARRVIQDETARDIIYEDATLDVFGFPVLYTPYFRHPDPSVRRRSGFLTPTFRNTGDLGFSAQTPYFYALAPNRDITITPYVSVEENPVLVGEYRSLTRYGRYTIGGSITSSRNSEDEDDGSNEDGGVRGHFIGEGEFRVGNGFKAGFDALIASDDPYLRRYRFSSTDRAEARVYLERFRDDGFYSAEAIRFQSFREDEPAGEIPLVAPLLEFEQFFPTPVVGGEFEVSGNSLYLRRTDGQDVGRLSGAIGWSRTATTSFGVALEASARLRADLYRTVDAVDTGGEDTTGRVLPQAALRISYPWGKRTESASHVIEPLATLVFAPFGGNPDDIPNEDSLDVDLDELRIFSPNRVTGLDQWEDGPRATVGFRYNRMSNTGWEFDFTIGQSYRLKDSSVFSDASGLNDTVSDVVGSMRIAFDPVFSFGHRYRFDTDFDVARYEAFGSAILFDRLTLTGSYVFVEADPVADSDTDRAEISGGASLSLTETWTLSGNLRRDIEEDRFVSAGGGVRYSDECAEVDFSVNRRFNDVTDADASTDFGLQIRLKGLEQGTTPRRTNRRDDGENRESAISARGVAKNGCSRLPNR